MRTRKYIRLPTGVRFGGDLGDGVVPDGQGAPVGADGGIARHKDLVVVEAEIRDATPGGRHDAGEGSPPHRQMLNASRWTYPPQTSREAAGDQTYLTAQRKFFRFRMGSDHEEVRFKADALKAGSKLTPAGKPGICGAVTAMCNEQDRN